MNKKLGIVFIVLILLPLTSCSGGFNKAKCENIQRAVTEQSNELNSLIQSALSLDMSQISTLAIIVERTDQIRKSKYSAITSEEKCFTQAEVNEAKDWLARNP